MGVEDADLQVRMMQLGSWYNQPSTRRTKCKSQLPLVLDHLSPVSQRIFFSRDICILLPLLTDR